MFTLIVRRSAQSFLTLLAISVILFFGTNLLPGDVATAILGQQATPEALAAIRDSLGLDQPAWVRYLTWLADVFQGDFGTSLASGRPVASEILPRLSNTFFLAAVAALVAVPLSVILGICAAIWEGSLFDRSTSILSLFSVSIPEFFVGYVLILFLSVKLNWFPSLSTVYASMTMAQKLGVIVLPVMTLTLVAISHMLRMTRTSILSVMALPFVEMAFLKGLPHWKVIFRHALPNAAAPIVAVVALNLANLVVGVVVIEVVFVYPGIGQLMVDAVFNRDLPMVQACGLVFAATYVGLNMISDIVAILVNPRLKRPR